MLWKYILFLWLAVAAFAVTPAGATPADAPWQSEAAPSPIDDPVPSRKRNILAEVLKQAVEQPLHFAMSAGPVWLSRCLTATPWFGWAVVPVLAYREWRQWPSQRWWDPPLDAGFLVLGLVVATWSGRTLPGPSPLAAMRRRDWQAALVRLVPAAIRRPLPAKPALP